MEFSKLVIEKLKNHTAYDYLKGLADYPDKYGANDADIIIVLLMDFMQVKFGEDIYGDEETKMERKQILDQLKPLLELLIALMKKQANANILEKLNRLK